VILLQVTRTTQSYFKEPEFREEGGTPNIVGCIRAGLAMQLKEVRNSLILLKNTFYCLGSWH